MNQLGKKKSTGLRKVTISKFHIKLFLASELIILACNLPFSPFSWKLPCEGPSIFVNEEESIKVNLVILASYS